MKELLNIDHKEFELTVEKVEEIKAPFYPLADKFKEFIPDIEEVLSEKNITDSLVKRAKRIKLDIASIRTSTKKVKDTEKSGILKLWNAIQKCHNVLVEVISEKEEKLDAIVKHFENIEKERIDKLQKERQDLLNEYEVENTETLKLWEMDEKVFSAFLKDAEYEYLRAIEVKKEESEKIRLQEEERERLKIENEKLQREADIKEEELRVGREKLQREQDRINDLEREKKEREQRELDAKHEEEQIKIDQEERKIKLEKEKKYIDWKKGNEWEYDIELKEDGKMVLYKKVSEFIFE